MRGSLQIQDAKKSPKIAIWAPLHNFLLLLLLGGCARYLQCFDTVGWTAGRASGL